MTDPAAAAVRTGPSPEVVHAMVALCQSVLPVWGRHLETARDHAEVAVAEMLSAFADTGPHLEMTARRSREINTTLLASGDGLKQLAQVCDDRLLPLMPKLDADGADAVHHVLQTIRRTIAALERIATPFEHESQMASHQVERMYVGFQYQDRISQMMTLLSDDMHRLQLLLAAPGTDAAALSAEAWMAQLESRYAMQAQRNAHQGVCAAQAGDLETDFF